MTGRLEDPDNMKLVLVTVVSDTNVVVLEVLLIERGSVAVAVLGIVVVAVLGRVVVAVLGMVVVAVLGMVLVFEALAVGIPPV